MYKGPAHGILETGDIIARINDQLVTKFIELEEILDSNVNSTISLEIERGGITINHVINVIDLHSISASSFLELGGGVVVCNILLSNIN